MLHYIEAYISPQQTTHQKHQTNKPQKSHENELQSIARKAMELHQANGITAQTCTYPLAICNIHGEMCMRQKSTLATAMCKYSFKDLFSDFCPLLSTIANNCLSTPSQRRSHNHLQHSKKQCWEGKVS